MNFSLLPNVSERISNHFGEYFNQQIPIREVTTGYHQPIPESLHHMQNIFPNEAVIIPLPEENKQMEVNVRAVKRKRDDGCPILLAKPAPLSRPNKRARLSDPDAYFVDISKPMMFQPPRTGFPAPSTMNLSYWPALVTIHPVHCGQQLDVEMQDDALLVVPGGAATWCMPSSSSSLLFEYNLRVVVCSYYGLTAKLNSD
ncbi:hypothetical protein DAPPUDRAFT_119303 [Daphnia pulex]|uniref:Uncharacterized protein n=1 Tax=Daphnia pulex TaxID=6669 RepID=E9HY50_DAPPU|nr:hypothetical protein DAPPUDRAFT_119303 [Daphnia pulex]|eukprot:EFX63330.1 hypothetical protein DAPPUDRAFT_119303 [Daphnia pulex]